MQQRPITDLKGVGPARAKALHRIGIDTILDAVYYLPRDYRDLSHPDRLCDARQGDEVVIAAEIVAKPTTHSPRRNMTIVKATVDDGTGRCVCTWFNQPWLINQLQKGSRWLFFGRVDARFGEKALPNPGFEPLIDNEGGILPVYPVTESVGQKVLRGLIADALAAAGPLEEALPPGFRTRNELVEINYALQTIHRPPVLEAVERARRRLAFEELTLFLLVLRSLKEQRRASAAAKPIACREEDLERFRRALPFRFTGAQSRVLAEIAADLKGTVPMNRLVQGDVGSGKTALALAGLYLAARDGRQGALMAPTEILAAQHYESMQQLLEPLGVRVALLTGNTKGTVRRQVLADIAAGRVQAVVGTHALIEKAVEFADLGLVITDEQHRFGVRQRSALQSKGGAPHMMVMSATPVPRTLALLLYGDLDISIVDELPPGRKPVRTRLVPQEKQADLYRFLAEEARQGRQSYVVCPLIEDSDKLDASAATDLYQELKAGPMKDVGMALVHGRMTGPEKEAALEAFRRNEAQVLVSTTVIEVGVNIPNASNMVIENAERFGLAQLHQLRGRVGRGGQQAWCFLCAGQAAPDSLGRLKTLCETNDGFKVAEADLLHRGPGEFLGTRQSGMIDLHVMRALRDVKLLADVDAAVRELSEKPDLAMERAKLLAAARARFAHRLEGIVLN